VNTPTGSSNRFSGVRRGTAVLAVVLLALALVAGCGSSSKDSGSPASTGTSSASTDQGTVVTTKLLSFSPQTITVKVGTKVTWEDTDGIGHTVTTGAFTLDTNGDGLRASQKTDGLINMPLQKGHDVSYTFTKPGNYPYYCAIHHGMNGMVIVTP
jgi:plastocyanin